MPHVHISVYQFQKATAEETLRRARESAYPLYRRRPGFLAYDLVMTGEDTGVAVTTWATAEQAAAAAALDDQWITEHGFTTVSWVQPHAGPLYFSSREREGGS